MELGAMPDDRQWYPRPFCGRDGWKLKPFSSKRIGLTFDAIADQITRIGRSQAQPIVAIPGGVNFPADFQISRQACHKAFRKAIAREPSLAAEEFRKLDSGRCEEMFMNLQPGIRKGNPRSIE